MAKTLQLHELNINNDLIVDKICEILEKQILMFDQTEYYCAEKFDVLIQSEEDLESNKSELIATIDAAKSRLEDLQIKYNSKKNELSSLKTEFVNVDEKYKVLVKEYENLEEKCLEYKSKCNISPQDKQTLDLDKKKFDLYNQATNIVWDYSIPIHSTISGCVRNKNKNYLQTFVYKNGELTAEEIEEKLWDEIEKGLMGCNFNENNENVPNN